MGEVSFFILPNKLLERNSPFMPNMTLSISFHSSFLFHFHSLQFCRPNRAYKLIVLWPNPVHKQIYGVPGFFEAKLDGVPSYTFL